MSREAIRALSRSDPTLARVLRRVGPITLEPDRGETPYRSLVRAVAYQQLTGKAAATILRRVVALFPGRRFPRPEDLLATPDDVLRAAGLSRAKAAAVKAIAQATLDGVVPTTRAIARMDDEEIVARLTTIRGVGRWTVEMLLIFKLGRPDVLPATDYGVRKGFALAYRLDALPAPRALLEHGERWRPYRSYAALSMWRLLDADAPVVI